MRPETHPETQCASGDTMCVWMHNVCKDICCVSGDTRCVWSRKVRLGQQCVCYWIGTARQTQFLFKDNMRVWMHHVCMETQFASGDKKRNATLNTKCVYAHTHTMRV